MALKTEDRRSIRTKKQLCAAFINLMTQKDFTEITVIEISNLAKVNRGTFYLHYSDIYDMRRQIEAGLVDELYDILDFHSAEKIKRTMYPLIFDICCFFNENREILNILLGKNGDMVFANNIKNILKEKVLIYWKTIYKKENAKENEMHFCFIASGILGVLIQWIYEDCLINIETLSNLIREMILNGSYFLEDKNSIEVYN
ncbi:MAG: TetR/AcrR family transcriptional regulator [Clostridia bacterium]|nr:TetR/AcrR family transcriptional regulator [Clostridia bacterium]